MSPAIRRPVELIAASRDGSVNADVARGLGRGYLEISADQLSALADFAEIVDEHGFDRAFARDLRAGELIDGQRARRARATFLSCEDRWESWCGGAAIRIADGGGAIDVIEMGLLSACTDFLEFLGEAPNGFKVSR